ncbi:MAG: hypothetical protein HYV63_03055 [Candidatus Schekmanbacteria bacterium]|nr:hypothetical protein [Candidatus Schekmanbacteria bacterium]
MGTIVGGCDLGKCAARFVLAEVGGVDGLVVLDKQYVSHEGRPMETFRAWYAAESVGSRCGALAVTGLYGAEVAEPGLGGLPESVCLEAALRHRPDLAGSLNMVSVGARGYSVLTRDSNGHVSYLENDKCSSGTGETMVKIAARFGLSLQEADRLASTAAESIAITARCSVFAKSEMTHFGNQGKPADQLFLGYFESVAGYVAALLGRSRVPGPCYLTGGGARIETLAAAIARSLGEPVAVDVEALFMEALGACAIAADHALAGGLSALPRDPAALIRTTRRQFRPLPPARNFAPLVTRLASAPAVPSAELAAGGIEPAVLGLDLGSTGSKAVLTSVASGEMVVDLYDRTRGNPVEAAKRLVRALLDQGAVDVRAIGVTGSGREAAATVLRATFPGAAERIVVINEIVAHATAAIRCDPDHGRSLSVVEIGGQDAKFIQIAQGQIVESDMNKACSAGTGSFLEEQALFYGVTEIGDFTHLARRGENPPELGQMCTVFVAEAAAAAHREGFSREDLFAGFQYSVIHNYINRVMGQRTFGERVFFQGKPASGDSLPWTLAAVTGREVVVPSNPGAMGAWGIGLCAIAALGHAALLEAEPVRVTAFLDARRVKSTEFQCRDRRCATLCRIEKSVIEVEGRRETVLTGGACPKYEVTRAALHALPPHAPSAFDERDALLAPYLAAAASPGDAATVVAVPLAGACYQFVPWLTTFLRGLGVAPVVVRSAAGSLRRGEERCFSFDACAPVKVAHGLADAGAPIVFFPKILSFPDADGAVGKTCPMEQGAPEMVEQALAGRGMGVEVLKPVIRLDLGLRDAETRASLYAVARRFGIGFPALWQAVRAADTAQRRYEQELACVGERTLSYARDHGLAVVVVCGSLHVIHEPAVNAAVPGILRDNGVLALPVDCFPLPPGIDPLVRVVWGDARRALRAGLAARQLGGVFPLLLSSFGCGPASFSEHIFQELMDGYPHTALETDGHGGTAGYVTRVQAFLHAVRQHETTPLPAPAGRLAPIAPLPTRSIRDEKDARLVLFAMTDRVPRILASAYRSFGFDAVAAGPCTQETLAAARRDCSGKECIAYQNLWGAFRSYLERDPDHAQRKVLMQVSGVGMCRNCLFSVKDRIALRGVPGGDAVSLRHFHLEHELGVVFTAKVWTGLVTWDLINQLAAYHRALDRTGREVDHLYAQFCDELEALVGRPVSPETPLGTLARGADVLAALRLVDRAADAFLGLARQRQPAGADLRTILLAGDVFVRLDEFAGDQLGRHLASLGIRVIVEPLNVLVEYLAHERSPELIGLPTSGSASWTLALAMRVIRAELYRRVRRKHPWLPMPDARAATRESRALIARHPIGEGPIAIGSVLHAWRQRMCDGAVLSNPWGCGPALITESLLRQQRHIPMLFVYHDGTPIDERRLRGFAYQLRRRPARTAVAAAPELR